MKTSGIVTVVAACALLGHPRWCASQEDEVFFNMRKRQYAFSNWVGQTEMSYSRVITNWVPDWGRLGAANLLIHKTNVLEEGISAIDCKFAYHPTNAPTATVSMDIWLRPSIHDAHNELMRQLALSSSRVLFRLGATNGIHIGDRCYLSPMTSTNAYRNPSVILVRNNVVVELDTWEDTYAVTGIASEVDCQLKALSTQ